MRYPCNFRVRCYGRKSKAFEDQAAAQGGIATAEGSNAVKHVYDSGDNLEKSTYYILDAQGKRKRKLLKTKGQQTIERRPQGTISVYDREVDNTLATITYELKEQHIYGSSRLGLLNKKVGMLGSQNTTYSQDEWTYSIGDRSYEISNHLGNVLSVISDKPIPHVNGSTVDYYFADLRLSQDYSPFGVTLEGRGGAVTPPAATTTTQIVEEDVIYTNISAGANVDANGDLYTTTSSSTGWSNGASSTQTIEAGEYIEFEIGNNPTSSNNYMVGLSYTDVNYHHNTIKHAWFITPSSLAKAYENGVYSGDWASYTVGDVLRIARENGNITYYLNGVLERTIVDASPSVSMVVDIAMYRNNSMLGCKVDNLVVGKWTTTSNGGPTASGANYRYGFNGMEADDEVRGKGNNYDYGARMYDARVGRFLNMDPKSHKYPGMSPYNFVGNRPVVCKDFDGNDYIVVVDKVNKTITIKAVLYLDIEDQLGKKEAQKAADFWNNLSGDFDLRKKEKIDGKKINVDYQINFEIEVKESFNAELCAAEMDLIEDVEMDGELVNVMRKKARGYNYFQVIPEHSKYEAKRAEHSNKKTPTFGFVTAMGNQLYIDGSKLLKFTLTGPHEVGHLLGLDHWGLTIMNDGFIGVTTDVGQKMIQTILGKAGIIEKYINDVGGGRGTAVDVEGEPLSEEDKSNFKNEKGYVKESDK